ncbi:MAG: ice-binding family protein [Ferruginibacter sp.]
MKKNLLIIAQTFIIVFVTHLSFSQVVAPPLGSSASFVLFSSQGAVTNGGVKAIVTGNVGTNGGGSTTGFGNVNGVIHDGDAASIQAAADLLIAYNQLNATTATNAHAPGLGGGETLFTGVYNIGGTSFLDLTLNLDAQGDPNAVFIFKINGAFSTNAAAKIKLLNGAQACNVFWKVEGKVDMATGTYMRGNIIANNAEIVMAINDTLEGRAFSTTGAITVAGIMAYTPLGCGTVVLSGPVAPTLGATACYALFSGSGNVGNSGVTYVTGDVGTNVGATAGYNPLLVAGTIHTSPDASTGQSATALTTVYNYLTAQPHDIQLMFPALFGNGLELTPHTYLMNTAASLTDTVYLNALNNPNAVFIIKINGAFAAAVNSKVKLVNGAQAKNVYWLVEGTVDIAANSVFNGTIVGNNGLVSLGTGVIINGRVLATNRALNTSGINAVSPSGNCSVLPVTWLYFRGKPVQKDVLLEWGTTNEMNNGFYTIEKSRDGQRFETLTTVNATKAVGPAENNYSFLDRQPFSLNYYRISQTDKDGQVNPYNTIMVKMSNNQGFDARSYVQGSYVYLQTSGTTAGNGTIELYSIEGKRMSSQKVMLTREPNLYKISYPVQKGMYLIHLLSNGKKLYTGKVMQR